MDDIDPARNAGHAAILRSPLAHARIARLDPSAALELPGVVGVLTGADVAAMSHPFPVGVENPPPYYAAAHEVARYVGEPLAVVVARDRYTAEDALELIEVEYEPLEPVLDAGARRGRLRPLVLVRRPGRGVRGRRPRRRGPLRLPALDGVPVECYGVVADWNEATGALTAWANFQGPFTLHSVAAGALGLKGSKLRLITPPNSGGSFGIKATVYVYVVLIGLASRKLGVPVRWTEDRLEHLAGELRVDRADHRPRGRVHERRRAARAPLRRARGRRRLRPGAGAGEPLPDARLADRAPTACRTSPCGTASCSRTAARPAQPRLRRPAALHRARADDGDRRRGGSASTRPSCARRNLIARGRVPLPHALGRPLRLGRLRGLPRRRARARPLRGAARRAARGARGGPPLRDRHRLRASSRRSRTWATSRSRRPPRSAPPASRSRATPKARRWRSRRSAGSPCGSGRRRRARGTRRSPRRSSPTRSASSPRRSRS